MELSHFLELAYNASLLLALAFIFDIAASRWRVSQTLKGVRPWLAGVGIGILGVLIMVRPLHLLPGVVFDTRSVLLGVSGLFFGTLPTAIAMLLTAIFRLYEGGVGAWPGVLVILATGTAGCVWRRVRRTPLDTLTFLELYLFGVLIHGLMLGILRFALPPAVARPTLAAITMPVLLIYPFITAMLGYLLTLRVRREALTDAYAKSLLALRESEEKYRLIFELSPLGIFHFDQEGRITACNEKLLEIAGAIREELLGLNLCTVHNAEAAATVRRVLQGQPAFYEGDYRTRNQDRVLAVRVYFAPLRLDNGVVTGGFGIVEDVTEQRRAALALQESEARYRSLFDNSYSVMLLIDPESGAIVDANKAACQYYGYTREQLLQLRITDINTLSPEQIFAEMQRARNETRNYFLFRHRMANGEIRDVEVYSGPVTIYGRHLLYSIVHDITERQRIAAALQSSEYKFRSFVEQSLDGFALADEEGLIVEWNHAMEVISGLPATSVIGRPIWDVQFELELPEQQTPERYAQLQNAIGQLLRTGEAPWIKQIMTRVYRRPDGSQCFIEGIVFPIQTTRGFMLGSVTRDITERKQVEMQLQHYTQQLEQLVRFKVRELEQERAKVIHAGKLAALGEMATGVAHELNQPLTSLLLDTEYLQMLGQRGLDDTVQACISPAELLEIAGNQLRDIHRCRRIIDHLRAFGRVSNETPTLLDLNQPIRDVFILIEQRLREHNITVLRDLAPTLPPVMGHAMRLEQVFLNLISNAEYALAEMEQRVREGAVTFPDYQKILRIRSYVQDQHVCVEIQDNGCGMSPAQQERLFEPFFTTKPVGQGTGLGLSISYGIITELGGEIFYKSAENEGTTFIVCLPLASNAPDSASLSSLER